MDRGAGELPMLMADPYFWLALPGEPEAVFVFSSDTFVRDGAALDALADSMLQDAQEEAAGGGAGAFDFVGAPLLNQATDSPPPRAPLQSGLPSLRRRSAVLRATRAWASDPAVQEEKRRLGVGHHLQPFPREAEAHWRGETMRFAPADVASRFCMLEGGDVAGGGGAAGAAAAGAGVASRGVVRPILLHEAWRHGAREAVEPLLELGVEGFGA
jgi:hypothetical protein